MRRYLPEGAAVPASSPGGASGVGKAERSCSASSAVILPAASRSRMRRRCSFIGSLLATTFRGELGHGLGGGDLTALEPVQNRSDAGVGVVFTGRLDVHERQCRRDPVQTVLDRRVADAEKLLHLLDGTVRPHEGRDKNLIVGSKGREGRGGEPALNGNVL